jgi:hypothetical protein
MAKLLSEIVEKSFYQPLEYKLYVQAFKDGILESRIAKHFHVPSELVRQLASDPDHGGEQTVSSFIETLVALELEKDGILGISVSRGAAKTDLIDGWGRMWDVKAPPSIEVINFDTEVKKAVESVVRKLEEFPEGNLGILLCTSFLYQKDYIKLQEQLRGALTERQKFLVRSVHIEGVL